MPAKTFSDLLRIWIRRYFILGVIVLLPFVITIKFLLFIVDYFDRILEVSHGRFLYVIPQQLHPDQLLGFHVPGLGVIFTVFIIFFTGVLSRNYIGNRLIHYGDTLMAKIPLGRVIYRVVKDALHTYTRRNREQFSKVVLVEFPRPRAYAIGFLTGLAPTGVQTQLNERMLNVFIPTTPNPTSGFYIMVAENEVKELKMTVEDAFKLIVSGGVASPEESNARIP